MERINLREIRKRVSWGSIFGGVMTVLAISVLLSILATSISLFMFNPTEDDPTSGIGTNVGIWSAVSLIVSLLAGGFVAGKLAGADGMIHGFLVWATSLIVTAVLVVVMAVGAVKLTANVLGSVASMVGSIASGAGSVASSGVSALSDQVKGLFDNIDFNSNANVNTNSLQADVRQALRKSGVKELQPYYIQNQLNQIQKDFKNTVKKLALNPKDAESIINGFLDRLKNRADKFGRNISHEDIVRAISNNTNLSPAEVDRAANQYQDLINQAVQQGKEDIANLQQAIENAQQEWQQLKQEALVKAEQATNAAARSALISFIALLIGAIICALAGAYGTKKTLEGYEA